MGLLAEGIDDYDQIEESATMGGSSVGFVRYGVSEVRRQVEDAKAQIDAVNAKVKAAPDLTNEQKLTWARNYDSWKEFYESTQGVSGAFNQFRDSTYEKTLKHQEAAEKYTRIFGLTPPPLPKSPTFEKSRKRNREAGGGGGRSININPSVNPSLNPSIGLDVPWMKILKWGAIGAGGLYVGWQVYKRFTPTGKAMTMLEQQQAAEQTE